MISVAATFCNRSCCGWSIGRCGCGVVTAGNENIAKSLESVNLENSIAGAIGDDAYQIIAVLFL